MSQAYMLDSATYEREGRRFVEAGIGTIGWNVYALFKEIDFDGNVIDDFAKPLEWIFPDPARVSEQQQREEAKRQRLERAKAFPVEGISGEFDNDGGMEVWPTDGHESETLGFSVVQCSFCKEDKLTLFVSDDYRTLNVCRDCLSKMFDALEHAHNRGVGSD